MQNSSPTFWLHDIHTMCEQKAERSLEMRLQSKLIRGPIIIQYAIACWHSNDYVLWSSLEMICGNDQCVTTAGILALYNLSVHNWFGQKLNFIRPSSRRIWHPYLICTSSLCMLCKFVSKKASPWNEWNWSSLVLIYYYSNCPTSLYLGGCQLCRWAVSSVVNDAVMYRQQHACMDNNMHF